MAKKRKTYRIVGIYDTETCNIGKHNNTRAYSILYIDNDVRNVDIYKYEPVISDKITLYRHSKDYLQKLKKYIEWGEFYQCIPIVCAYNLMFDLQTLMYQLSKEYTIVANAQSSTNVYTLDLMRGEDTVLRFWDTFHLQMAGLAKMGEIAGLKKLKGDWDYSLIRTPETPLTEQEIGYAKRDVQVIPAYLRYLLHANDWLTQDMFGYKVITQTSLVRQMAKKTIAPLKIGKVNGKDLTLEYAFMKTCKQQLPQTFEQYALRKACFRGGFTFTSAKYASKIVHNVASLDVTSMHHTFINGRFTPMNFSVANIEILAVAVQRTLNTTIEHVLNNYHKPFEHGLHIFIEFKGVKLKKNSVFEKYGIATLAQAKFKKHVKAGSEFATDPRGAAQENVVREFGGYDIYENATFAFGKLYSADTISVHLTELELWVFGQVYDYTTYSVIYGENTICWKLPPDYVTLQSNILYEMKDKAKKISKTYMQGECYSEHISSIIPVGIADKLKAGTMTNQFFDSWYTGTVKGQFNGIYGTQAQDIYKPTYMCVAGDLLIDEETKTTPKNWSEKQPKTCKVFYNYGSRIVGGSRLHLVIALILLDKHLKSRIKILAGDTDSIKLVTDNTVTDEELERCLEPLYQASTKAINKCMKRVRKLWCDYASCLTGVGGFEIENCGDKKRWQTHIEYWNKGRISVNGNNVHVTCAGLPRPEGKYHIEHFICDMVKNGYELEDVLQVVCGYNVHVCNEISHTLEGHKPFAKEKINKEITDYTGRTSKVNEYQACSLYGVPRILGDTLKLSNENNVEYLREHYNIDVDTREKWLVKQGNEIRVDIKTELGFETIMKGYV